MPRVCTICSCKERAEIDAALVAGEPLRGISRKFFGSVKAEDALSRHRAEHLPVRLVKAQGAAEVVQAGSLLERLLELNAETRAILREARLEQDNELALKAVARVEKQIELEGKLLGELREGPTVNLVVNAEWLELRALIVQAVSPYPEAREAVLKALN